MFTGWGMPARLRKATVTRVPLSLPTDIDPEQDTYAEIRQARIGENVRRAEMTKSIERTFDPNSSLISIKTSWNYEDQRAMEVYLTLAGTNLLDENGEPYFAFRRDRQTGEMHFDGTFEDFRRRWDALPLVIADAFVQAVYQVNPEWDPNRK